MNDIINTPDNNDVGMISLRQFRAELNVVPSTSWRWIQRGWLDRPINIGGRQYLTTEMIRRFKQRASQGEFATLNAPPPRKANTARETPCRQFLQS
jgi:hypothetical protein